MSEPEEELTVNEHVGDEPIEDNNSEPVDETPSEGHPVKPT